MMMQLLPVLFLWLVPSGNPKDVVAQLDRELATDEMQVHRHLRTRPNPNGRTHRCPDGFAPVQPAGAETEQPPVPAQPPAAGAAAAGGPPYSSPATSPAMLYAMLAVAAMPPLSRALSLPLMSMLPPVLVLLGVPVVETFVLPGWRRREQAKRSATLSEGLGVANPVEAAEGATGLGSSAPP